MIGILALGSYIPSAFESNLEKKLIFGTDDDFILNKVGVEKVSRKRPDEETSDMCVKAFEALIAKSGLDPSEIECIAVCTQNPDGNGIPHTSAIVHGKIKAPDSCAAFDISLGCSGYVYSLSIVKSFMEANGFKKGVLFTADPYSKTINPGDKNTALLFGDAATATLLGPAGDGAWMPVRFIFASRGSEWEALKNSSGALEMNGRAVFNFSATAVPAQIKELLARSGFSEADIDLFIFHQGSKYIVDTLKKRMQLNEAKVPLMLAGQGNTVSSSIPLVLERRMDDAALKRVILSGFGVGLSWASCLLERNSLKGAKCQ